MKTGIYAASAVTGLMAETYIYINVYFAKLYTLHIYNNILAPVEVCGLPDHHHVSLYLVCWVH